MLSLALLAGIMILAISYGLATYRGKPGQSSFSAGSDYAFRYDFSSPTQIFSLPSELNEISGLASYAPGRVVAIQDEDGVIFVYDLAAQQVVDRWRFGKNQDYEGVAINDSMVFVLESDGDLHAVRLPFQPARDVKKYETEFSHRNDTEGVAFDSVENRLLIVSKEQDLTPDLKAENRRGVYAFDLERNRLLSDAVYVIDQVDLGQIVYGDTDRYLIKPSGIAVEPETGNLFILASVGKILIVLSRSSEILHVELLDEQIFPQPEGITFDTNGDLLISSEAARGKGPNIVRYARQELTPRNEEESNNE